jgi:hypothetical protein
MKLHRANNKMRSAAKDMLLHDLYVVLSYARDISWPVAAWKAKVPCEGNIETDLMDIRFEDVNFYT